MKLEISVFGSPKPKSHEAEKQSLRLRFNLRVMKLKINVSGFNAGLNPTVLPLPVAIFFLVFLCSCQMQPAIHEQPTDYEITRRVVSESPGKQADLPYEVSRRLLHFNEFYPREKLYIHTDKSHYLPGETVWFKLYLADASSHQASPWSGLVYVELADTAGIVAGRRYIEIKDGTGHGDFVLDTDTEAGVWILRGHTSYMRNYGSSPLFSMELRVIDAYPGRFGTTDRSEQTAASGRESRFQPSGRQADLPQYPAAPAAKASPDTAATDQMPVAGKFPEALAERFAFHPNDLEVKFFPEGGDLVAGLGSVVAVKATVTGGAGIGVMGIISDDLGNHIAGFATGRFGLGRFEFTPQSGRKYYARVETADTTLRFDLPGVTEMGYTLQVNNNMPDEALVRIETNSPHGLKNAFLVGHIREQIFCLEKLPEGSMAIINIDKKGFPAGIVHFTLFSAEGMPVAERLVFISANQPQARLEVIKSAEIYDHRNKVGLELELTDGNGDPLRGEFSLSVTDSYVVPSHHDRHNIETYLLLSSDLSGTIENPGYFFDSGNADRHMLLDLLMMTHGWRRFKWDDLLAGRYPEIIYPPGTGHIIDGRVTLIKQHDAPVRARVMLSALGDEFFASSQVTGEDGQFLFHGIELYDTTILVLQADFYRERREQRRQRRGLDDTFAFIPGSENFVALHLGEPETVQDEVDIAAATAAEEVLKASATEAEEVFRAYLEDSMKDPLLSHLEDILHLEIEEVEIRRRRPVARTTFDRTIHGTPFRPMDRIIPDEYPFTYTYHNTWEFIRARKPGLIIDGGPPRFVSGPTSMFAGPMGTLVLLNGMRVESDAIGTLPIETISFIDIIRLPQASIYGSGWNLVIAVFTKTFEDYRDADTGTPGLLSFYFPGYYQSREFYSPRYDEPGPHHDQTDYRTTLFWEPEIKTGEDGRATVTFFTSDKASVYRIIMEGITEAGIPLVKSKEFGVQQGAGN